MLEQDTTLMRLRRDTPRCAALRDELGVQLIVGEDDGLAEPVIRVAELLRALGVPMWAWLDL